VQKPVGERFKSVIFEVDLLQANEASFEGVHVAWHIENGPRGHRAPKVPGAEYFDAEQVGPVIKLRHWRPGDRFQPIGMAQPVKLQDLFTNAKIPRSQRHQLVLGTTQDGQVFWVEGLRIAERFKLTGRTIRRLHWQWQRL
jgi:tRNA(Ile)-lysidine synthase